MITGPIPRNFVKEHLESFAPDEKQETGWYAVEVSRSNPQIAEIEVYAESQADAEKKALEQAGDHEFSSGHGAEYQVEGSRFIRE